MVEAETQEAADRTAESLAEVVRQELG